jgi:hypothetical protein
MNRRTNAISLLEATRESPVLAHLADLALESKSRLELIAPLVPKHLLNSIHPGPVEGATWCLLLDSNAIAAKLRQLLPALVSHLKTHGHGVETIRLKVQSNSAVHR